MAIDTKKKLVDWIYTKLGGNVINIEIDDNTIEQNIEEAIDKFSEYSSDITYRNAYVLALSAGVSVYDMPAGTDTVYNFQSSTSEGGINTLFSSMNVLYNAGAFDQLLWDSGQYSGIVTYELGMKYLEMVRNLLTVEFELNYSKYSNQLTVVPTPTEEVIGVIEMYTKRDVGTSTSLIYNEEWIKKYALALTKITYGYILGKYENTALPDGSSLNYSMWLEDGKLEVEKLDEELQTGFSPPLGWIVA